MKNLKLLALVISFPCLLAAQNIHGIFTGELTNDSTHRTQNFELGLSEYRGKITGYTYTTFIDNDTFYYSIKRIKAERKDGKLVVEDVEMVGNNFPERAAKHVKQITSFPLLNDSTIDIANGKWTTTQTKKYYSIGGSATVRVQENIEKSDLLAHLQEANIKTELVPEKPENTNTAKYAKETEAPKINRSEKSPGKTDLAKNKVETEPRTKNVDKTNLQKKEDKAVQASTKTDSTTTALVRNPVIDSKQDKATSQQTDKSLNSKPANEKTSVDPTVTNLKKPARQDSAQTTKLQQKPTINPQQGQGTSDALATNSKPAAKTETNKPITDNTPVNNSTVRQVKQAETNHAVKPAANNKEEVVTQLKPADTRETISVTAKSNEINSPQTDKQKGNNTASVNLPETQRKQPITENKELRGLVANRKNENMQDLFFKNDSLVLSLYDNGIVDGDTVSVFLNGEPIIVSQMLKTSAIKKTIYISEKMDSIQLVLFADNLGTIPPNTGLLTVRDGDDLYQVRFSADLQKNASITLRRKK